MPEHFRFVCMRCNAQWFARVDAMRCPRCNHKSVSDEQLDPPWRNYSERRNASAKKPHLKQLSQGT